MDGELIIVTIISGLFGIFGLLLLNNNWFKKENFRVSRDLQKAENKLKLKKLEKELGLNLKPETMAPKIPDRSNIDLLGSIAPALIEKLPPEIIADLTERFLGQYIDTGETGAAPEGIAGMIGNFVNENPELIKGLLEGLKSRSETSEKSFNPKLY